AETGPDPSQRGQPPQRTPGVPRRLAAQPDRRRTALPALAARGRRRDDPRPRRTRARIDPGPDRARTRSRRRAHARPGRTQVRRPSPRLDPGRRARGGDRRLLSGFRFPGLPRAGDGLVRTAPGGAAAAAPGRQGCQDAVAGVVAGAPAAAPALRIACRDRRRARQDLPGLVHAGTTRHGRRRQRQFAPCRRTARRRIHPRATSMSTHHAGHVAVIGRPNVGKSTLVNALVGAKVSIVSNRPQTTRHRLLGIATFERGQLLLVDTPGIHREQGKASASAMHRWMNRAARGALEGVDAAVLVVEAGRWDEEDALAYDALREAKVPVVLAVNQVDRFKDKAALLPFLAEVTQGREFAAVHPVSALKRQGLDALVDTLLPLLPEQPPLYGEDEI